MTQLRDRVAIVTGAGGCIGSATADVLAARGAKVVLADVNLAAAERAAEAITVKGGVAALSTLFRAGD